MKVLTNIKDNVIVYIAEQMTKVENGYSVPSENLIIAETVGQVDFKLHDVATMPAEVKPATHCYDGKVFTPNANYVKPPMTQQELEQQLKITQKALDELILKAGGVQ